MSTTTDKVELVQSNGRTQQYTATKVEDDDVDDTRKPTTNKQTNSILHKGLIIFVICSLLYCIIGVTYLLVINSSDSITSSTDTTETSDWNANDSTLRRNLIDIETKFFAELSAMLTDGNLDKWTSFAYDSLTNDFIFPSDLSGITYNGLNEFLDETNGFHVPIIGTFDIVTSIIGSNIIYRMINNETIEMEFPVRTRLTRNECPSSGIQGIIEEEIDIMTFRWFSTDKQWKIASFISQSNKIDIETCSVSTTPTPETTVFCDREDYFKDILKEEYTKTFGGIINDQTVETAKAFEASGVVYDSLRNVYWVVFDNLWSLAKLQADLTRSEENILVVNDMYDTNIDVWDESSFEGIAWDYDTDIFYLLTEGVEFEDNNGEEVNLALIRMVSYDEGVVYIEHDVCAIDFEFASDNKGFESLNIIQIDGINYFIGLCEGNYCLKGDAGRDAGHGRVVLFEFNPVILNGSNGDYQYLIDAGVDCLYPTINMFELPLYVNFTDYAAMHFRHDVDNLYDVAIASQTDAAVWIGKVDWSLNNGPNFTVNDQDAKTYQFPKSGDCETIFCNVEGVTFTDNYNQLVMVSDRAKGGGDQPWICGEKDQSVHVFKYRT